MHCNTLEFLGETQKYIHLITHPPQIEEHLTHTALPKTPKTRRVLTPLRSKTPDFAVKRLELQRLQMKDTREPPLSGLRPARSTTPERRGIQFSTEDRSCSPLASSRTLRGLNSSRTKSPLLMKNERVHLFLNRSSTKSAVKPRIQRGSRQASPTPNQKISKSPGICASKTEGNLPRPRNTSWGVMVHH